MLFRSGMILALYFAGWQRRLAERASRRGLGTVGSLRWFIASQYQLPLGTFLGIAALLVVYAGGYGSHLPQRWTVFFGRG